MKGNWHVIVPWAVAGIAILALAATAVISAGRMPSANPLAAASSDSGSSYLYVVTSDGGSLTEALDGTYLLTLTGVSDRGTYFSDRPERDAGSLSIPDVIDAVFLPSVPSPNAAMTTAVGSEEETLAVTLSDPVYDADAASLSFTATALEALPAGLAHLTTTSTVAEVAEVLGAVELFIDDGFNKCSIDIENYSAFGFLLESYSPSSGDRWGPDDPPQVINANETAYVTFRFRAEDTTKSASLTFRNAFRSDAKPLTINVRCDSTIMRALSCQPYNPAEQYTHCVPSLSGGSSVGRVTIVNTVLNSTVS